VTAEVQACLDYAAEVHVPLSKLIVEVGAGDGEYLSHSKALIERDWWALLVEPDERAFAELHRRYVGRSKVAYLHAAVGTEHGRAILHRGTDWSVSHLEGTATHVAARYTEQQETLVLPLADLLAIAPTAGILSIDAEGMDTAILKAFLEAGHDAPLPQFLIIEGNTRAEQNTQAALAAIHGYRLIDTVEPNQIFALEEAA
jgi:FkbM family methyltransferase